MRQLLSGQQVWGLCCPFTQWSYVLVLPPSVEPVSSVCYYLSPFSTISSDPSILALPPSVQLHPTHPTVLLPRPLIVTLMLGRACRCLTKPADEATCLSLDRRLELVILPDEPHQFLQFVIFPHQSLYLMPEPLITCKKRHAPGKWRGCSPREGTAPGGCPGPGALPGLEKGTRVCKAGPVGSGYCEVRDYALLFALCANRLSSLGLQTCVLPYLSLKCPDKVWPSLISWLPLLLLSLSYFRLIVAPGLPLQIGPTPHHLPCLCEIGPSALSTGCSVSEVIVPP